MILLDIIVFDSKLLPKKYFTKYLPVDGEIYQMDKYLDGGEILTATLSPENYIGMQKVKLFLCSRDIQVGDEIRTLHNHTTGIATFVDNKRVEYGNRLWTSRELAFNVIGEVSPEATWITEGMEFDEDDVRMSSYDDFMEREQLDPVEELPEALDASDGDFEYIIKFRCPSSPNHFH